MMTRGLAAALALAALAACGGGDDGGDDASGDDAPGDAPASDAEIRATVTFGDGRTVELVAPANFNLSAGYCTCGGSSEGIGMTYGWMVERADAPGEVALGDGAILSMSHMNSRYSGSDGAFTITTISAGELEATFHANDTGLGSYPIDMRPEEEMQIASVAGGSLRCEGRSDGVYAGCWQ